jgi:Ran GTPase-activating protein (RanGAP) involved in mRNA processing and transport
MMYLNHLKMTIHLVSYTHLSDIMKSMPNLESLELSGTSLGENLDNGHKLKQLFGHLKIVDLDNFQCLTSTSSVDTILKTFNDDNNRFWSDVTCSIQYDRALLSAFGHAKY